MFFSSIVEHHSVWFPLCNSVFELLHKVRMKEDITEVLVIVNVCVKEVEFS